MISLVCCVSLPSIDLLPSMPETDLPRDDATWPASCLMFLAVCVQLSDAGLPDCGFAARRAALGRRKARREMRGADLVAVREAARSDWRFSRAFMVGRL